MPSGLHSYPCSKKYDMDFHNRDPAEVDIRETMFLRIETGNTTSNLT